MQIRAGNTFRRRGVFYGRTSICSVLRIGAPPRIPELLLDHMIGVDGPYLTIHQARSSSL